MKILAKLLILIFLFSCTTQKSLMTREGFASVQVGTTAQEIKEKYGTPYSIHTKGRDTDIYEYIERITMGGSYVVEQRRYYIVITDGKVIGKYLKVSNPPPFEAIYSDDPYPNY